MITNEMLIKEFNDWQKYLMKSIYTSKGEIH